jgi:ABC-2 type transport system permease protein
MWNVFVLQWKRLIKQPLLVLMFLGLTIIFVYFMGGAQINSSITVPVYTEELPEQEFNQWLDRLNETDEFTFEETTYEEVEEDIRMNQMSFAMELTDDTYRFLVGRESEQLPAINQYVYQVFSQESRLAQAREEFPEQAIEIEEFITVSSSQLAETSEILNQFQIPIIIGMTLYFTVYTVMFLQMNLIEEKKLGTWNRLIFSPVSKTQIYLGHLTHYYLVGLIQIMLAFFILTRLLGVDLGTNYLPIIALLLAFLFAIVALGLFIAAAVPTPQSLQVVIPIVATSMAMLGGAFWPLEIVTNRFILFLSEFMPIKHTLHGIVDAIQYNLSITELLEPIGILLLMGVLFMGIGVNLMERVSTN